MNKDVLVYKYSGGSRICQKGHGERAERGSGAEPPAGSRGKAPGEEP